MPSLTVYPSVDGDTYMFYPPAPGVAWATLIAAAGNGVRNVNDNMYVFIGADTVNAKWDQLWRPILLFDTSGIPDGSTIISAVFSIYGFAKGLTGGWSPTINIYSAAPASDLILAAGDYNSLGSTPFCDTPLTYAGFSVAGYNDFTLNANGLLAISKTGLTKFGLRDVTYDVGAVSPIWGFFQRSFMQFYAVEKGTIYRPKLAVTYSGGYTQALIIT